ncbi:MAG: hypothetical protein RLY93_20660 [Sumerlaeia bacterium]
MNQPTDQGQPPAPPLFQRLLLRGLCLVREVTARRAGEYSNGWGESRHEYKRAHLTRFGPISSSSSDAEMRALSLADLCDVKHARIASGCWKADTFRDLAAYLAAYQGACEELEDAAEETQEPMREKSSLSQTAHPPPPVPNPGGVPC